MMIRKIILAGSLALGLASAARTEPVSPGATTDFITKAAQSDAFERREGRIAERRAQSPAVRRFAAQMVSAHTMTTKGLMSAISRAHLSPPPPPTLNGDQIRLMTDLRGAQGRDFDKTYIDQQVQAHQDALGVMQGYAQSGPPGPVRDAAAKTAPLVQRHLDMAKGLQAHMS
jgi:putative membrane protein